MVLRIRAARGTGLNSNEYSGVPDSVTFAANETSKSFDVMFEEDATIEDDATLTLTFRTPLPQRVNTTVTNLQLTLTVTDDDGPPAAPDVSVRTGHGYVVLSWPAVQNDSPVERYEVRWKEAGGAFNSWQSVGQATSYRVESLTNNRRYEFQVRAVNAHGTNDNGIASRVGTPTATVTGTPTAPQHLNVKNTESGTAKIGWTRPANALQQEQRYAPLAYSIIGSYELQVCNSAVNSCRNRDNENWYVLAVFNNHWSRDFTHQVLAPGVIRDNRYRVRAININGVASPWSNIAELEPTVIEHLLTRSPQHDTVWADFRVVHNPDGKPLYVRHTNLGTGSTTDDEPLLLTRKGDYRIVLTDLSAQNHYRVDLDFVDTFDSDRKLSGWVWTPRQGVFPLLSIYGKNVLDAEVYVGGAWQDAGGRALTVRMGESGKYRVRMDDDCSGERRVYVRRTSNVAGQLRATPVDADPFQSELSCGTEDWKEITVRARPLDRYPTDMRTEALLRTPFAVQYKHEVWETREGGSLALVSDSSAWVKVLVDRPASAVLPDPSSVTFTDPAAGSTGGPTLSWNAVDGASAYLVEWRHGLNYSSKANQDRVRITGASASIPMGPSGHGPITARVRAYSTSGISNWVQTTWDSRPPALKVADTTIFEADGTAGFLVTLNPAASGPVTVGYSTSAGSATPTLDYVTAAGTLTFQRGVKTQTVWVDIIDDTADDSGETFRLTLSNPTGSDSVNGRAVIADGVAIATILNRDQQASLSATLPDTASTSRSHSGDLDNPTVVVAFNQAVTSFTRETPSVSVTGASIVSVAAHTEAAVEHAYLFTLDPEGDDDVIFSLIPGQPCTTGGICTNARNMLSRAPSPLTIAGPEEVVIISYLSVEDATASEQDDTTIDFVVTLSPASDEAVTVDYATANGTAVAGGDYRAKSGTLTFAAGQTSRTVRVSVIDDDLEEDQETLHLNLTNPSGATVSGPQGTGTIDGTELERLTARFINMPDTHDGDNSFSFAIEFSHDVDTSEADMKASALTVTNAQVTGAGKVSGLGYLWEVTVEPDSDNDVVITFSANRDCALAGAVCKEAAPRQLSNNPTATVAGPAENTASDQSGDDEPPTATFSNVPASHDGATAFTFNLAFSQDVTAGLETLRDDAFSVSGGNINQVRRTEPGSDRNFTLRVKPEGDGPITITLPATTDCQADGAICTEEGVKLSTGLQVTVGGPEEQSQGAVEVQNSGATGAPTVTGTPQVGQVLTADTSLIADEDGLTNATFRYQWIAGGTDIDGATGSSFTLTSSQRGETIRVRVTFTDDADNEESLTSEATVAVDATVPTAPTGLTVTTGDQEGEIKASWEAPSSNGGDEVTGYRVQWKKTGDDWTNPAQVSEATATGTSHTIDGLAADTAHTVRVTASNSAGEGPPSGEATATAGAGTAEGPAGDAGEDTTNPLTGEFQDLPDSHDGSATFTFQVLFSEDVGITYVNMRDDAFTVDEGDVTGARRVDGRNDLWEITVEPDGDDGVAVTLTGNRACTTAGAVCTKEDNPRQLTNSPTATVTGPAEAPPTNRSAAGAPTISGTPQVDQTLTADTSAITDEDGLENVSYSYQWLAGGSDISGATRSSYTLTASEQAETIQVKVSFTDDEGNEETLTSAATVAVAAAPNRDATGAPTIGGTPQVGKTLTAATSGITDEDGLTQVSYSYQWNRNNAGISGATGSSYTLTDSDQGATITVQVTFTDDEGNAESLTSAATGAVSPPAPLTATLPVSPYQSARHKGADDRPQVIVAFSLPVASFEMTTPSVSLTGATVSNVRQHEEDGLENAWMFFLDPDGTDDIVFSLATGRPCDSGGICAEDGTMLSSGVQVTLPGPDDTNSPATGAPAIDGTPQVGETLTASTSDITDQDGLTNVSYSYQWIAGGSDIAGATGASYLLTASEQGQTIQVRVTFTDDADNEETLTSVATDAVTAKPTPLTATLSNVPASHDGSSTFTFTLSFSENVRAGYARIRDHAFTIDEGDINKAQRVTQGSNQSWTITVKPDGNGDVKLTLPDTTDCDAEGAICTYDDRMLSHSTTITIAGPGQ